MARLLFIFLAVPLLELFLLIEIGQRIGTLPTVGIILFTGTVGAVLARQQGLNTLARLRADLATGQLPADPIVDGLMILVGAALLMTPGLLTDCVGFLGLIPSCRHWVKRHLTAAFEHAVRTGSIAVTLGGNAGREPAQEPTIKDVTPRDSAPPRNKASESRRQGDR